MSASPTSSQIVQPYGITPGGTRTSASLNAAMEDLFSDWQTVQSLAASVGAATDRFTKRLSLQTSAMAPFATAVGYNTMVGAPNSIYLDAHHLVNGSTPLPIVETSTVQVYPEYGLVTTLPSSVPTNQFVVLDANNTEWVPRTATISRALSLDSTEPGTYTASTDPDLISAAFTSDATTSWYVDLTTGDCATEDTYIWIEAQLPLEYLYQQTANAIVIHPEPMFGAKLLKVSYQDSTGTWHASSDTPTFLPWSNYIPSGGRPAAPEMFLIAPTQIRAVKFCYLLPASVGTATNRAFYLSHLGVYSLQLANTGVLNLDLSSYFSDSTQLASSGHIANPDPTALRTNQPQITTVLDESSHNTGISISFSTVPGSAPQALYQAQLIIAPVVLS